MEQIFITNKDNNTLENRLKTLLQSTRQFDILVGYFFSTGFNTIAPFLYNVEKTRILIGISTDTTIFTCLQQTKPEDDRSTQEKKKDIETYLETHIPQEYELTADTQEIAHSALQFIEWIQNGKLEVRAYPTRNIHAKLYIMQFKEGDRDQGRVITGSSNLTEAGLINNHEFNVEIPHVQDYQFASAQFNTLWEDSIDVSEQYVQVIQTHTWINNSITPYELYLKFLYEYFKEDLQESDVYSYAPKNFLRLTYQEQAVTHAKRIVQEYGGVFISDVVGLGKTYIATMLAKTLGGKTLVIAPPALLDEENPGSWKQIFRQFHVDGAFTSTGKLESRLKSGIEHIATVIIDESHRFRSESTQSYELLAQICRGKKVILVSATPYNNKPSDLLSQIKLFQNSRTSTIPNAPNLEGFFKTLEKKLQTVDKKEDYTGYIEILQKNTKAIRNRVLKYLMVRRTRTEIIKYFNDDIQKQGFNFPKSHPPQKLFYEFNETEDAVFTKTIELLSEKFQYARYTPFLFLKKESSEFDQAKQINMRGFMKLLLVKRLESSVSAFRTSISNFMKSYANFITGCKNGYVYTSKKYSSTILSHIEEGNTDEIETLIEKEKAVKFPIQNFVDTYITTLEKDLQILGEIQKEWNKIHRDPKLNTLIHELRNNPLLQKEDTTSSTEHVIIFTESKDTVYYLVHTLKDTIDGVIGYSGSSTKEVRQQVIENFDAKAEYPKNDYRILVCTDALSEGVNLHRSNIVINYDIPWNPTRVMQRVGRINRIDTEHTTIHTYNFFPTAQSNKHLGLEEAAKAKIHAFLTLLGGDAELLTEGEPLEHYELFKRINAIEEYSEEDNEQNSELQYFKHIQDIKHNTPDLYKRIIALPKKARTTKIHPTHPGLLSYFRRGQLSKFIVNVHNAPPEEVDFIHAARLLQSDEHATRAPLPNDFYTLLEENKTTFQEINAQEQHTIHHKNSGNQQYIQRAIQLIIQLTNDNALGLEDTKEIDLGYLNTLQQAVEESRITNMTLKKLKKDIENLGTINKPEDIVQVLQEHIPKHSNLLTRHVSDIIGSQKKDTEVILSMYFTKG